MKTPVYSALIFLTLAAGMAPAAIPCNQFEIVLYGRVWQVNSYYVQDDIVRNPNKDFEMLEPDGIACQEGVLYASGDREVWDTGCRLAIYAWENDELTYSGYRQMPSVSPDWWGPDGLTFNTSGDPGSYGSGLDELVSVEADAPAQVGIIDIATGAVSGRMAIPPAQDITYVAGTGQFAVVASGTEYSTVTLYDRQMLDGQGCFFVIGSAYGLAAVSGDFGRWLSREDAGGDGFLMAAAKSPVNALVLYDLAGNPVGPVQPLPVTPKARIPLDGGLSMIEPAFGGIEAIAVDEQEETIFIGDHGNAMIHVLQAVRLAGDADRDGAVNLSDLAVLAGNWLGAGCLDPQWCGGADVEHSGDVDWSDYAVLADQFGEEF